MRRAALGFEIAIRNLKDAVFGPEADMISSG